MIATQVGYAGGTLADPSYHDIGDHREAVEVTFDPSVVSYETLLDVFWGGQPNNIPHGQEPRVHLAVMPRGPAQRAAAERSKAELRRRRGETIYVDIVPEPEFWAAERLHQKFALQRGHETLIRELADGRSESVDTFLHSTAAARLNTWLSPYGDEADLTEAAERLGIEPGELATRLSATEANTRDAESRP